MLKQFVDQLSTDLGLEQPLDANADGFYSLRFERDVDVSLREDGDGGFTLRCILTDLPENEREEYMRQLMAANLFGRETGGATLGISKDGKKLMLVDFLSEGLTYKEFYEKLEDFVNYADAWRADTIEFTKNRAIKSNGS